ncbi:hypothetical protein PIB30_088191, partial [Stylosanthes scabra]|nr:hypothetical protein [Stylosanthes scabra]
GNPVQPTGGFFALSLYRFGFGGSSASAASTHRGPDTEESLGTQGQTLQQQMYELQSLKDTLAEWDARAEEQLRRMEEMSRQMTTFYDPLRLGSSAAVGGSGSSTAPPLPPRPPPRQPDHPPVDDDDDYKDA